jgi:hypothetical protein
MTRAGSVPKAVSTYSGKASSWRTEAAFFQTSASGFSTFATASAISPFIASMPTVAICPTTTSP